MTIRSKNLVCFGGGTGLPALLSGVKHNPWLNVTAIVNMFDTGGSSGELRDRFGILPPGDILKCLLALSEDADSARKILLRRIRNHTFEGHTGGNLLLMALERVYGSYDDAIDALAQVLSATGTVVPVTQAHSTLCARYADGEVYRGEIRLDEGVREGRRVEDIFLDPLVGASARAITAIASADVICVGPGSFYTSVISNLLPQGIREAIVNSPAPIIFVCNLLCEGKGMDGCTVSSAVITLERYLGRKVAWIIANKKLPSEKVLARYAREDKRPVGITGIGDSRLIVADLWLDETIARHDSARLAHLIYSVIAKRGE